MYKFKLYSDGYLTVHAKCINGVYTNGFKLFIIVNGLAIQLDSRDHKMEEIEKIMEASRNV
jgi:hypothetical protein